METGSIDQNRQQKLAKRTSPCQPRLTASKSSSCKRIDMNYVVFTTAYSLKHLLKADLVADYYLKVELSVL
ncbi:MAG: hypothetical protein ACLFVG_03160 [Candidatus Aminicenantes bacterium]